MESVIVRTITVNASQDDLTEQDYREIFEELREKYSLRVLEELLASTYTYGTWDRYAKGKWVLTRQAKSELRRAIGLDALPLTILESVADVDADAEVIEIGDKPKNRVFLTSKSDNMIISANGVVTARLLPCTGCTRARSHRTRREMTAGQAAVWDKLTTEERDQLLGV